jgi:hypothetical protein
LAALEGATLSPLAFTIQHPLDRLAAGGAAIGCLVMPRRVGRFMAPWPVAQWQREKSFCCVTTRGRSFRLFRGLWHRLAALAARTLGRGVLDFDRFVGTPLRLALGRLPAVNGTQACGILAVTLVPTAWLELLSTAFAQASA